MQGWEWVLCLYAPVSVFTFFIYGFDKHRAVKHGGRIRERTLHLLELFGGWPGALAGMAVFHHKRRKPSFMLVFVGIVVLHIAGWAFYIWIRANS